MKSAVDKKLKVDDNIKQKSSTDITTSTSNEKKSSFSWSSIFNKNLLLSIIFCVFLLITGIFIGLLATELSPTNSHHKPFHQHHHFYYKTLENVKNSNPNHLGMGYNNDYFTEIINSIKNLFNYENGLKHTIQKRSISDNDLNKIHETEEHFNDLDNEKNDISLKNNYAKENEIKSCPIIMDNNDDDENLLLNINRIKRDASAHPKQKEYINIDEIDPIFGNDFLYNLEEDNEYVQREKRRAERELTNLHNEYTRCKKELPQAKCEKIHDEFLVLAKDLTEKFSIMTDKFSAMTDDWSKKYDGKLLLTSSEEKSLEKKIKKKEKKLNKHKKGDVTTNGPHKLLDDDKDESIKITSPPSKIVSTTANPPSIDDSNNNTSSSSSTTEKNPKIINIQNSTSSFSHFHQHPPKIHEDLIDDLTDEKFWMDEKLKNLEQLIRDKSNPKGVNKQSTVNNNNNNNNKQRNDQQFRIIDSSSNNNNNHNDKNINKDVDPVGASGPFITLCEKLGIKSSQQNHNPSQHQYPDFHPIPQTTAFTYNGPQFHIHHTSTGPMFLPGEQMKGSAQIQLNPGYVGTPICFMAQYRPQQPMWIPQHQQQQQQQSAHQLQSYPVNGMGYFANNFGKYFNDFNNNFKLFGIVEPRNKNYVYVPLIPKNYVESMQSEQGFSENYPKQQQQQQQQQQYQQQKYSQQYQQPYQQQQSYQQNSSPVFCTYTPTTFNKQQFYGQRKDGNSGNKGDNNDQDDNEDSNIPNDTDIIYASYPNQLMAFANKTNHNYCKTGMLSCFGTSQCISKSKWCDSKVDCLDASDESSCSCKSRIPKTKLCDGYVDCPRGSDEMGCFGCDKFSFSCYYNKDDYINGKKSTLSMCYSSIEKCDGFENCLNGKDEKECSMLVRTFGHHMSYMTSYSEGFLHRNYKGQWYPVCDNPMKWAKDACESEVNHLDGLPMIEYKIGIYPGQFIQPGGKSTHIHSNVLKPIFSETCHIKSMRNKNVIVYARCPLMKCGNVKEHQSALDLTKWKSTEKMGVDKRSTDVRVVGGIPSNPMKWPFIIGLYRDGYFHCGGMIHNDFWIITAAHCVDKYFKHYYEIRAGMLRRYSYSPMSQIIKVKHIFVHERFNRNDMKNDLALLKLDEKLLFNRWVKPICLPAPGRTTNDNDWIWGPKAGTFCTAVGWGALREKGPDPDHLREVSVPVLARCKHLQDREGAELCAGETEGGRDACQGDSGGPLFCKSVTNSDEWYLAGVISHGEGCARPDEPGVYTRVALYIDWILEMESINIRPKSHAPLQDCPGYRCVWGGGLCIPKKRKCDGVVDCLGGEDEIECALRSEDSLLGSNLTVTEGAIDELKLITDKPPSISVLHSASTIQSKPHQVDLHTTEHPIAGHRTDKPHSIQPEKPIIISHTTEKSIHSITTEASHFNEHHKSTTPKIETIITKKPLKHDSTIHPDNDKKIEHEHTTPGYHHKHHDSSTQKIDVIKKKVTHEIHSDKFICKKILQSINKDHRCDHAIDCEDGTDEQNCSCKDYLVKKYNDRICNGVIDCVDLTDEKDCLKCKNDEYSCYLSKKCIPLKLKCDDKIDCEQKDDESDCLTLSDGHTVKLDVNFKPILNHKGIVCKNEHGTWRPVCSHEYEDISKNGAEIAKHICASLGFRGFKYFNTSSVIPETALKPEIMNRHVMEKIDKQILTNINSVSDSYHENVVGDAKKQCVSVFIECLPHSIANYTHNKKDIKKPISNIQPIVKPNGQPLVYYNNYTEHQLDEYFQYESDDFHWKWSVGIFIQGKLSCIGVLLNEHWIITDSSCFNWIKLDTEYISAVFGNSKTYLNVKGPFEQIRRIDCYNMLKTGNIILLHLEYPVEYNRECLPSYIPEKYDDHHKNYECLAVSFNKYGHIKNVPIIENEKNQCFIGHRCFESKFKTDLSHLNCNGEDLTRTGVIICKSEINNGWYPESFYSNKKSLCSFEKSFPVLTLNQYSKNIQNVLDNYKCEKIYATPNCKGFRCELGQCLSKDDVCDGKVHCHDESDEYNCNDPGDDYEDEKCTVSHIKCGNGKCVPKTKFCNQINDCGDFTDEPNECSCYTYLRATDPIKICDGIRNCWDKTDENPQYCDCRKDSFKCVDTPLCIPYDFVCDNEKDCPNGDDEENCRGLENSSNEDNDGYSQVIEQSYGIWHTKCFPRSERPDEKEIEQICKELGYKIMENVKYRIIDYNSKSARSANSTTNTESPTKAIISNKFSSLQIHDQLTLYMKPSHPIAKLVKWDETDDKNCFRMEIRCG